MKIPATSFLFCILLQFTGLAQQGTTYPSQKTITCNHAAVVTAHPLASKAGIDILKKGGNAFDAAITVQLVLAVVYPQAGNIGGGGFMVAHLTNGANITLDYREKAPAKASRDMYLDANGDPVPHLSEDGHLSAGIPGTVAGLFAILKYAKLPFADLIQPAIDLAENGFTLTAREAASLNDTRDDMQRLNIAPVAFVKSEPWKEGDILVQKELAGTLIRIRDKGQKGFYKGKTAKLIVEEMKRGNGIISLNDLKHYKVHKRIATEFDYKNYHVVTMPLPSSGGIILQQMLKMIEDKNIGAMQFQTPASVQLMTEVERRAFADRGEFMGDPDFVQVPVKTLVSDAYLKERMKDYEPGKAGSSKITKAGVIHESDQTTHLSIIDAEGNAIAITTTLNDSYGSKTVVRGAGFILNDEMDDFSIKPGIPNMYGALGNEKNAIAPGKTMLSSMTPTIVLQNGQPYIIVGTPGGTTIPTSVFQTLVNIIEFNMDAADAVNKPKFHHQWSPDKIDIEKDFPNEVIIALEKMGYTINKRGGIGLTELILIKNGLITAVGDRRGNDDAEGY